MDIEFDDEGPTVREILDRMIALLSRHDEPHWALHLQQLRDRLDSSAESGIDALIACFRGMGSLNDLVLHVQRGMPSADNDEFDQLRASLYKRCQTVRRVFNASPQD